MRTWTAIVKHADTVVYDKDNTRSERDLKADQIAEGVRLAKAVMTTPRMANANSITVEIYKTTKSGTRLDDRRVVTRGPKGFYVQ